MSHHLAAAGGGYVWPNIVLDGDGRSLILAITPSEAQSAGMVRFLASFRTEISLAAFESAVDQFLAEVIGRLDRVAGTDTALAEAWRWVQLDRQDPQQRNLRRFEAALGYDCGEAPSALLAQVVESTVRFGVEATAEVAAGARTAAGELLSAVPAAAQSCRWTVAMPKDTKVCMAAAQTGPSDRPWQRAARAAKVARASWAVGHGPIGDRQLSEILSANLDFSQRQDADRHATAPPDQPAIRFGALGRRSFLGDGQRRYAAAGDAGGDGAPKVSAGVCAGTFVPV